MWMAVLPQIAFQSDVALNALLGISALHYHALKPDCPSLFHTARYYFDQTITKYRSRLQLLNASNARALLATSVIITYHTWLTAHSNALGEPYSPPVQTYQMARGVLALCDLSKQWVWEARQIKGAKWMKDAPDLVDFARPHVGSTLFENNNFLKSARQDLAILLQRFSADNVKCSNMEIYSKTVGDLLELYVSTVSMSTTCCSLDEVADLHRRIISMPVRLPEFLQLLECNDIPALALLARNLVLLKIAGQGDAWWFTAVQGCLVADRSVLGINSLMPDEWRWTMKWPLRVASGTLVP